MLPLALFYGVIVAMSAIETQGYGDLFALLHAASFGLGLVGWALLAWVRQRTRAAWVPALLVGLALLAVRPGPLRPSLELRIYIIFLNIPLIS